MGRDICIQLSQTVHLYRESKDLMGSKVTIIFLGKMPKKVKNGPETGFLAFKENEFISLVWKWSKMKVLFFFFFFVVLAVRQKLHIQENSSS